MPTICCSRWESRLCDRIWRLRESGRLGKLRRPYLTVVEERLLGVIEKEYGIIDKTAHNFQSTKN
ncbi:MULTISPECIES: hypothetical protein [Nostocaceae]|uniref:hypothetical protein n=1 Tax=Nostocaceae TaxID=1162 RepID=UPI001681C545|nr:MULTISPECIES: hypothetical protein [Nostocaceae]MBD2479793.1 hypothetical protein [Anabaena sp. FACHB-83]